MATQKAKTPKRKPAGQRMDGAYQELLKKIPDLTQGTVYQPGTPKYEELMKRIKKPGDPSEKVSAETNG